MSPQFFSEWNASNLEELNSNGVTHILNITRYFSYKTHSQCQDIKRISIEIFLREIDNFFPAVFKYLNIREWDVEETDLLK